MRNRNKTSPSFSLYIKKLLLGTAFQNESNDIFFLKCGFCYPEENVQLCGDVSQRPGRRSKNGKFLTISRRCFIDWDRSRSKSSQTVRVVPLPKLYKVYYSTGEKEKVAINMFVQIFFVFRNQKIK